MANFGVSARTLIHLGGELITSDEIALFELIKNSFDAGSKRVSIRFVNPVPKIKIQEALDILLNSSTRLKASTLDEVINIVRESCKPELGNATKDHINASLMKLKKSQSKNDAINVLKEINFIEVADTGSGMSVKDLESVFLRIGTSYKLNKTSKDNRPVLGNKGIGRLAMMRLGDNVSVTSWVSTAKKAGVIEFDWIKFDDPELTIDKVEIFVDETERPSKSRSGTIIKIVSLKIDWTKDEVEKIIKFLRRLRNPFDSVDSSFSVDVFLNDKNRISVPPLDPELSKLADREMFLDFFPDDVSNDQDAILKATIVHTKKEKTDNSIVHVRTLGDVRRKLDVSLESIRRIGPFSLKIKWFNRRNMTKLGLGGDLVKFKDELDEWNGGIAIYRDGFRVGLSGSQRDGDWLGLDDKALRGGGYVVNRIQTVGALEISKTKNPLLIDRSNREGLIENPEVELLKKIMLIFGLDLLRGEVTAEMELEKKEKIKELIEYGTGDIEDRLKQASNNLNVIKDNIPKELKSNVVELGKHIHFISNQVTKYRDAVSELKETREDILELAGVGTVMHSILHELTRATGQTRELLSRIANTANDSTKDLLEKLEHEIKSINTRLRQLDPLSPSGRQKKSKYDIVKLIKTILDGYAARFERHKINIILTVDDEESLKPVMVNMVRGFFSLAIENLLTNSVYWVQQYLKAGEKKATISIDLDSVAKVITVSDNGPGIAHSDLNRIFKPGFSLRPQGNGFGLYIAREVAEYHGATLEVDSKQDDVDQRHRTFIIQMPME